MSTFGFIGQSLSYAFIRTLLVLALISKNKMTSRDEAKMERLAACVIASASSFFFSTTFSLLRNMSEDRASSIRQAPNLTSMASAQELEQLYGQSNSRKIYVKSHGTLTSVAPLVTHDDTGLPMSVLYVSRRVKNLLRHQKSSDEMEQERKEARNGKSNHRQPYNIGNRQEGFA